MKYTRLTYALTVCFALLSAGCPPSTPKPRPGKDRLPLKGVTLRLAVAADPAMAEAIMQLRGEWNAQTGAELEIVELSEDDLRKAETLAADALIIPSYMLGELAERDLISPVPKAITESDQWAGVFNLSKLREAAWGGRIVAVPFGSPVFCCYYRADLLEKLGRRPPQSWEDYQELAKLLNKNSPRLLSDAPNKNSPRPLGDAPNKNSPRPLGEGQGVRAKWSGTLEPLAPGWAGLTLIARAASAAKHRSNYSTLFNIETMEPLIAEPPFVEALQELVAAAKLSDADPLQLDPAKVREAFHRGECGMAVTWPTAAAERREEGGEKSDDEGLAASAASETPTEPATKPISVGFAELPGSPRVYNVSDKEWSKRSDGEDTRVTLLALTGRLGVVSKQAKHQAAAFQLLVWLSDDMISMQVSAVSPATTMFRDTHQDAPGLWVEETVPHAAAAEYGGVAQAAFAHEQWLSALRIPGRAEYLAALDESVAASVRGEKTPREALEQAAAKWREITNRLGVEKQKTAYQHSVGL